MGRVNQAQEHTLADHVLLCFPAAVVLVVAPAVIACGLLPLPNLPNCSRCSQSPINLISRTTALEKTGRLVWAPAPFRASKNRSYQESGINGRGLDRYATFAKVQPTMMGIVADPRGDAN